MKADNDIRIKRAYEPAAPDDGARILVDRLWPRGLSKAHAEITLWLKEVAPTPALRKWFGHEPARWDEFGRRYRAELAANPQPVAKLAQYVRDGPVTLLYAARDEAHNHAVVLADYLRRHAAEP